MKNKSIRFYDNDKNNFIGNPSNKIECILIDDKQKNILLRNKSYNPYLYFQNYMHKYPYENELMKMFSLDDSIFCEINPPSNGINLEKIQELKEWCKKNKKQEKIIFFDWDRTISVTDGFFYLHKNTKNQLKQYLKYILGGEERFKELQVLFKYLHKNKVNVYILTNNSTAENKNSIKFFLKLVHLIYPKFKSNNLLYGLKYLYTLNEKGKIIKSNKILFIENEFPQFLK